jgi:hypothetical protein
VRKGFASTPVAILFEAPETSTGMRQNDTPSIDDLLAAFKSLSPSDQAEFNRRTKKAPPRRRSANRTERRILSHVQDARKGGRIVDPLQSLDEAAINLEKSKSQVSRLISNGKLLFHGERGTRDLKVYSSSVLLATLEELKHTCLQIRLWAPRRRTPQWEEAFRSLLDIVEGSISRVKQFQIDAGTVKPTR